MGRKKRVAKGGGEEEEVARFLSCCTKRDGKIKLIRQGKKLSVSLLT